MTIAYLGLGSNMGDRAAMLAAAGREMVAHGASILRESSVIETEPFGVTEQPQFLNKVIEIEWPGSAAGLLAACKAVEVTLGRTPGYRWGPRLIDIDILLFGAETIDEPDLQVPHPGLAEREFVQRSLRELKR